MTTNLALTCSLTLPHSHCDPRTAALALWLAAVSHCGFRTAFCSRMRAAPLTVRSSCARLLPADQSCSRTSCSSHVTPSLSLARGAASAPLTHVDRISPPSLPVSLPAAGALILSSFFRCLRVSHSPCQHCDCPLLRAQPLVVPCSPSTAPIALSHTLGLYCFLSVCLSLCLSLSRCPPPPLA